METINTLKLDLNELLRAGMLLKTWFDKEELRTMNSLETPDGVTYACTVSGPYNNIGIHDTHLADKFIKRYSLTVMN